MVAFSLLPIGIAQAVASVDQGLWVARSADFLQQPVMQDLRWLRIAGDGIFLLGVAALVWSALGLWTGSSCLRRRLPPSPAPVRQPGPEAVLVEV
jgi:nitric oxide reductase subunit B